MAVVGNGHRGEKPWESAGRGTTAGRLLFSLYNGCAEARQKGNEYSLQNKIEILRRLANKDANPDTRFYRPPPKKPVVKVPKFRIKRPEFDEMLEYRAYRHGKRNAAMIVEKMREDYSNMGPPPLPSKPPIGPKEKERLQKIMEWAGRDFKESDVKVREPPRRIVKGSIEDHEILLNKIAGEISEREVFLRDMMQLGRLDRYQDQILREIDERVKQMKLLHETIQQQEQAQIARSLMSRNPQATKALQPGS